MAMALAAMMMVLAAKQVQDRERTKQAEDDRFKGTCALCHYNLGVLRPIADCPVPTHRPKGGLT